MTGRLTTGGRFRRIPEEEIDILDRLDYAAENDIGLFELAAAEIRRLRALVPSDGHQPGV
jgi:hypothetical protein